MHFLGRAEASLPYAGYYSVLLYTLQCKSQAASEIQFMLSVQK